MKRKDKKIPFAKFDKTLLYYYDYERSQWNPIKVDDMIIRKMAGYYHATLPTALTVEEEGWSPIRITKEGHLKISGNARFYPTPPSDLTILGDYSLKMDNTQRLYVRDTVINDTLILIRTAIDAIKAQTDKLQFTAQNNLKTQETAEV